MSFAINYIINHPDDANLNYYWDDFFQLQEPERKEVEHSPVPKLPIKLPSPSPLLEATKPSILLSTTSNILPPIILPPLAPFAVNMRKIGFPTTIAIPPSEIPTPPLKKTQKPPLKFITPKLTQRNSKVKPDEQELTRSSSLKSLIMNINKVATSEFPLNTPSEPKPVILMNSPKENSDEMQVNLLEASKSLQQDSEENHTFEKLIKRMRLELSVIPEFEITQNILHPDDFLNQDYFRPSIPQTPRIWTDKERVLLIKGIEKYGIGHYKEISDEFLPNWSTRDLCIRTMRLIGRQDLQLYKDWKGDENAIKIEYEKNKSIGLKTGMWKAGTLVYDNNGVVLKMIQEMSEK